MARLWSFLFAGLFAAASLATGSLAAAPHALAQAGSDEESFSLDDPGSSDEAASKKPQAEEAPLPAEETGDEPALLGDEQALEEERAPDERFRQSTDPYEDPNKSYFFVGANWRYVRMPAFMLELFLESAPSLGTAGSFFGEFGYRKDGFQVLADVGYMKWNFTGPFQLAGDPEADTEWMKARFNILMATATLTWSTSFADWFSLEYGVEAGLAFLFGDMTRTEAYRRAGDGQWQPCPSWVGSDLLPTATDPGQTGAYCDAPITKDGSPAPSNLLTNGADEVGAQYGVKVPHGVTNKGIPRVLPVIGPRLSLRFKPIHQVVLRVDIPLPVFPLGFVGGLSAQYGF